ncbi:hypothetical protein [Pseudomonas leptonychotis]|uniref:hypothetical protein n=1 Tax=Pseudomonas leptonychotis TaxID=2448482 RepID=UPI00386C11B8
MNRLTEARKALISRLSVITPANGYLTAAGSNVKTGWFNEVIAANQQGFPLIVVQQAKGKPPEQGAGALRVFSGFNVIGAVDAGLDGYEDALDDLELDLLKCLMPMSGQFVEWAQGIGVTGFTLAAAEHFPPGNGERTASLLLPVYIHTVISSGE